MSVLSKQNKKRLTRLLPKLNRVMRMLYFQQKASIKSSSFIGRFRNFRTWRARKRPCRRCGKTCGAQLCDHIDDLSTSLGSISSLEHQRLEGAEGVKERIILEVGENPGIATILVGGTDGVAAEETIRGLFDSLRSTCLAKEDDSVILGGGSLQMAASLKVREAAENCSGRERLSMEAFARALEGIPAALAANAGEDKIDALLELRSLHRSGQINGGIMQSASLEKSKRFGYHHTLLNTQFRQPASLLAAY